MGRRDKIVCDCGGRLSRPLPRQCPHCGARIVALRRRIWPLALQLLAVIAMFAALALYVWSLAGR